MPSATFALSAVIFGTRFSVVGEKSRHRSDAKFFACPTRKIEDCLRNYFPFSAQNEYILSASREFRIDYMSNNLMNKAIPILSLSTILLVAAAGQDKLPLSVERIFQKPSLDGVRVRNVQWSPDGRSIAYLRSNATSDVKDLRSFDVASGTSHVLVRAQDVLSGEQVFSKEEEMLRERTRQDDIGITHYFWSPDSRTIYIPMNGEIYQFDLATKATVRLTETPGSEFDPKISPSGTHLAYVRDGEIHVRELSSDNEIQLTTGATQKIKHGVSEYIAQEEMYRTTGYWWSPDGRKIAYLRIDNTPVNIFNIPNFLTPYTESTPQEYPKAGTVNTIVNVGIVPSTGGPSVFLDLGNNPDIYIARVDWLPGGDKLAVQVQTRNQDTLDLVVYDLNHETHQVILRETDPRWVNLHDHLRFLRGGKQFIWSSERDGFRHLYLYDIQGKLLNQITKGQWEVVMLVAVIERQNVIYFTARERSPRELHLYSMNFDGSRLTRISEVRGHHDITMSSDFTRYIDIYSNITDPPRVALKTPGRKTETLIEPNPTTELEKFALPEPEFLTIKATSGYDLHAFMIRPSSLSSKHQTLNSSQSKRRASGASVPLTVGAPHGASEPIKKFPAIVYVYGGPTSQIVEDQWGTGGGMARSLWHRSMAEKGYIVFGIDGRGTPGRGRKFQEMIHKRLGKVELEDQLNAVAYLKSLPYVDSTRIMIWGKSYGGFMTCMAMLTTGEMFKLGIAVAPVTDWRNYDTHYTERYLEHPRENADGYRLSSPISYANGLRNKLLIVHGVADDNVHFQDSILLAEELQKTNKQFDFMIYPMSTHSFSGDIVGTHLYTLLTRYIRENL